MAGAIRFGASISASGRYALQGRKVLAGLGAWVEAVNAGEGLRVHGAGARARVRLVYYDDASSPAKAAANAERLLDADAVEVLIGPYASVRGTNTGIRPQTHGSIGCADAVLPPLHGAPRRPPTGPGG